MDTRTTIGLPAMSALTKLLIWSFFILIIDHSLILAASTYGFPLPPIGIYAGIAVGLFVAAVWMERGISPLKDARLFFFCFAALAILGAIMYRGEGAGPDFGAALLPPVETPSKIGYAVWPAINVLAGASLYKLVRHDEYRRTIINAAFVALIEPHGAMEVDMWLPTIVAGSPGHSRRFAQKSNDTVLLVTI